MNAPCLFKQETVYCDRRLSEESIFLDTISDFSDFDEFIKENVRNYNSIISSMEELESLEQVISWRKDLMIKFIRVFTLQTNYFSLNWLIHMIKMLDDEKILDRNLDLLDGITNLLINQRETLYSDEIYSEEIITNICEDMSLLSLFYNFELDDFNDSLYISILFKVTQLQNFMKYEYILFLLNCTISFDTKLTIYECIIRNNIDCFLRLYGDIIESENVFNFFGDSLNGKKCLLTFLSICMDKIKLFSSV